VTQEQRIAQLEQKVQALEGHQDQITPGAYSINSEGKIEEKLTGHLEAQGIDLPLGSGEPSRITWGASGRQGVIFTGPSGASGAVLQMMAYSETEQTLLDLAADGEGNGLANLVVDAHAVTLLDADGNSAFARLSTLGNIRLSFGIATLTYPGGSEQSDTATIASFPEAKSGGALYFTQAVEAEGNSRFGVVVNPAADSFDLYLQSTVGEPPAGTKEHCYWLAILID